MAIKGGQFLTVANGTYIDRIQQGGPGALNIPEDKIYELGNFQSVATVRDIPDLSFDNESVDVATEFESKLLDVVPHAVIGDSTVGSLHEFDFNRSVPIDIVSPFKDAKGIFTAAKGIIVPYLTLERVTYRFGVRQNSTQSFSLKGDSIYYCAGTPYYEEFSYNGLASQAKTFTFPGTSNTSTAAIPYTERGDTVYAYCVTLINTTTKVTKRLFHGFDYSDSTTGFTVLNANSGYDKIRVCYAGNGTVTHPQTVHQNVSVKPAAVRGKDIDVFVGSTAATPVFTKFRGVQSAEATRSVNLDNDEELGNHHYVSQDYDIPDVNGSLEVKPLDVEGLWEQIHIITGVTSTETVGPNITVPVPLVIKVNDPDGVAGVLKTFYVPDARFQVPGMPGRANAKLETTFNYTSDSGTLLVYDGDEFTTP